MSTGTEHYYRKRAGEYDAVYGKPERQPNLLALTKWLPTMLIDRHVLEIAAGTGHWTSIYADHAASVLATDINSETLAVARTRRSWPSNVAFAAADAFELPDVGDTFDAAFVGFFWSHVRHDQLDGFLRLLAKRLRPGSPIVLIDNRFVEGSSTPVTRRDDAGNTYQRRRLNDGSHWEVLKNFPTADDVRVRLERIGTDVEVTELRYFWTASVRTYR